MKYLFYFVIISCVLLNSCNKNGAGVTPSSYFCTELNGNKWTGEVNAEINDSFFKIRIINYLDRKKTIKRSILAINSIPIQKGQYYLSFLGRDSIVNTIASSAFVTRQDGGDVIGDYYYLSMKDSSENYIKITEVGKKRDYIRGAFKGLYIRDSLNIFNPDEPNEMLFEEGEFYIKLK